MAIPLAPVAWTALRIGAATATAIYVARRTRAAPKHIWRETALDDTTDGLDLTTQRSEGEINAHAAQRFRRTVRVGRSRGLEIDIASIGRIRLRRVD